MPKSKSVELCLVRPSARSSTRDCAAGTCSELEIGNCILAIHGKMSALRQARVNPRLSPSPKKTPRAGARPAASETKDSSVDRSELPTFDAVRPTQSGKQSGRAAADLARTAASQARAAQEAARAVIAAAVGDQSQVLGARLLATDGC